MSLVTRAGFKAGAVLFLTLVVIAPHVVAWDKIRVGAWNIETLGTPQSRDYRKKRKSHGFNVARTPTKLATQIRQLELDVLVVIEIDDTAPEDGVPNNRVLRDTLKILNRDPQSDWTYVLFPKYSHYAHSQHVGIAWNRARIAQNGDWYRVELGQRTSGYWEWDRHPHAMQFSRGEGRTDFVIIPIHMKAGRSEKAIDQRQVEATALVASLEQVTKHFNDDDLILIGDFNMTRGNEPAGQVFRDSRLVDLNSSDVPTHIARLALDRSYLSRNPPFENLQQISVAAPIAPEAVRFRRELSDHWPIVIEFEERADDD